MLLVLRIMGAIHDIGVDLEPKRKNDVCAIDITTSLLIDDENTVVPGLASGHRPNSYTIGCEPVYPNIICPAMFENHSTGWIRQT